jgi:putative hydrolases of HD superfamily
MCSGGQFAPAFSDVAPFLMVKSALVLKIFEGFSVQRWNDRIRPIPLVEMDKSAYEMVLAFFLGKIEEEKGNFIDWEKIIYAGFFELLRKIILSDIKAPVHRRIAEAHPDVYRELNRWVVSRYENLIDDDLMAMFCNYVLEEKDTEDFSLRVLEAAHKFATLREFETIKIVNAPSNQLSEIERELNRDLKHFLDIEGMQLLLTKQKLYDLMLYVEQLRNQIRWNQTPRIPQTSVLGHSLLVAYLSLLMTREVTPTATPRRLYNNFFCGLFHDLPECVTRDIVSPVKNATEALPDVVKKIEDEIVDEELYPLMSESAKGEIKYFTSDEFKNKIVVEGQIRFVEFAQYGQYNSDEFNPVDGEIIDLADKTAAFVEASQSIRHGVSSAHLETGYRHMFERYTGEKGQAYGLDFRPFFEELRIERL